MSADLLKRLIEAGTPAELIAEVAVLAGEVAALERRRASDRERQRAHRNEHNVTSRDTADVTNRVSLDKNDPQTPKELNPSRVCETRARFPTPDGVSDEQWAAFRKQRKKPINERSYTLLTNKLRTLADAGWPPGDMIDLAIERGWETVFEPRKQRNAQSSSNITSLRGHRPDPALDLLRAASAAEDRENSWRAGSSVPAIGSG